MPILTYSAMLQAAATGTVAPSMRASCALSVLLARKL